MSIISLAPLQGYTDAPYRNALFKHIGGVDKYYTPYLRLQNDKTLKKAQIRDVAPENNLAPVIPQILCNTTDDFLLLCNYLEDLGYTEVNWNLGCPYPMVAKRKLGSGIIPYPELINSILETCIPKTTLDVSIKIRLGYENEDEILKVLPILNAHPIKELIIHPRIGKELYKNSADKNAYLDCLKYSKLPTAYNGDILTIEDANNILLEAPSTEHLMIGRGLLKNPFLANEIKSGQTSSVELKRVDFLNFYTDLFQYYQQNLSGDSHQLNKLTHLWEYFSFLFSTQKKIFKRLKKKKNIDSFYRESIHIINNEEFE